MDRQGREWDKRPLRTVGYRYGKAPDCGKSYNAMTQRYEEGVSMAAIAGLPITNSFAVWGLQDAKCHKYYYEIDVIGYGGDDELVAIPIRQINYRDYISQAKTMACHQ